MPNKKVPLLSLILPCRNEKNYIRGCLNSLMKQDYPRKSVEIIVLDGMSTDGTRLVLEEYVAAKKIRSIDNLAKTTACALNLGISKAKGDVIVRIDVHAGYPKNYLSKCVEVLRKTGAWNVGGYCITKGKGYTGEAIAMAQSSIFGVGNSQFRIGGFEGDVDTVPFGAFPKETFKKAGLYNPDLDRNQDIELNYRIRKKGGRIYLSKEIHSTYFARSTLSALVRYFFINSMWNVLSIRIAKVNFLRGRHFLPFFALLLGILILVVDIRLFIVASGLYLLLDAAFSLKLALKNGLKCYPVLLLIFPIIHLSYALGILVGFLKLPFLKSTKNLSQGNKA